MTSPAMKVVLDTNVWLDWLLFADPRVAALKEAVEAKRVVVVIDAECEAELERVLGYAFYKKTLPMEAQHAHLAACRAIARKLDPRLRGDDGRSLSRLRGDGGPSLPRCADPDDQKFLELALAAGADCVLTRDEELLRLGKRTPFRIVPPQEFEC